MPDRHPRPADTSSPRAPSITSPIVDIHCPHITLHIFVQELLRRSKASCNNLEFAL